MRVLIDTAASARGLRRLAGEIAERHHGARDLLLVGIRRAGVPLAQHLSTLISELEGVEVPVGTVDISFYRDDAATALPNPRIGPSHLPQSLNGKRVVLVDDVLYTGRTVRAALDALLDYGRPQSVELAALVVRSGRELPIQADYRVAEFELPPQERVNVHAGESGWQAITTSSSAERGSPVAPPPGKDGKGTEE